MEITNLKFNFFVIFVLMFEVLIFYNKQLFIGIEAFPTFPTGSFGLFDLLFYFGSIIMWFLSMFYTIAYGILSTLFNVNIPILLFFNSILATYLIVSLIYFIRGVNE